MKILSAIGVPLDGSEIALRSLGCAMWMASRVSGRVHILNVDAEPPAGDPLRSLGVSDKYRAQIEFHHVHGDAAAEILAAEARYNIDLIVMTARGASTKVEAPDPLKVVGHVARTVIEKSRAPVLLLPAAYEEVLPWRSVLVPLSGEPGTDDSLTVALRLAQALDLTVTIAHVAAPEEQAGNAAPGLYSDQPHHEYPHMLNEFVARACSMCGAAERERIEGFSLCHGDITRELLGLIETKRISLLAVGWHGQFVAGHALVLKTLIQKISCPLLLVKAPPRQPFRLKVGEGANDLIDRG